jgi:hypothetical protein
MHSAPALSATSSSPPRHLKTSFLRTIFPARWTSEESGNGSSLGEVGARQGHNGERVQGQIEHEAEELHDIYPVCGSADLAAALEGRRLRAAVHFGVRAERGRLETRV